VGDRDGRGGLGLRTGGLHVVADPWALGGFGHHGGQFHTCESMPCEQLGSPRTLYPRQPSGRDVELAACSASMGDTPPDTAMRSLVGCERARGLKVRGSGGSREGLVLRLSDVDVIQIATGLISAIATTVCAVMAIRDRVQGRSRGWGRGAFG
jgi:hypothetical protein